MKKAKLNVNFKTYEEAKLYVEINNFSVDKQEIVIYYDPTKNWIVKRREHDSYTDDVYQQEMGSLVSN